MIDNSRLIAYLNFIYGFKGGFMLPYYFLYSWIKIIPEIWKISVLDMHEKIEEDIQRKFDDLSK